MENSYTVWTLGISAALIATVAVCYCIEWCVSRSERAQKLRRVVADSEWLLGLKDLGELGPDTSGAYQTHRCGNRLRVGAHGAGNRLALFCPFCLTEVSYWAATELPYDGVVVPLDHFRRIAKERKPGGPKPPPTAA